jgi:hypothetical protein
MANEADDAHEVDERAHDGDRPEAADEADHGEGEEQREEQQAERAAARVLASAARHAPPAMRTRRPAVVTVGRATRHQAAARRSEEGGTHRLSMGSIGPSRLPHAAAQSEGTAGCGVAAAWLRRGCARCVGRGAVHIREEGGELRRKGRGGEGAGRT